MSPKSLLWPIYICSAAAAVLTAHGFKWPRNQDQIGRFRTEATAMAALLPNHRPVALRVVGLGEEYFNQLRYVIIPRPLELKIARADCVILVTADSTESAAGLRLLQERPDLTLVNEVRGPGFRIARFQPAG